VKLKVSVIVPVYNAQNTILRCVDSIKKQSYSEIEIIVVDDGSTDDTGKIVQKIQDSRVIYCRQNNAGVSAARNKGIEMTTGDYILFVDSDDVIDEMLIERMVVYAQQYDLDLVCCNHTEENTTIAGGNSKIGNAFAAASDEDIVYYFHEIFVGMAVGKLFRKNMISDKKIRFPENMNLAEDFYFTAAFLKTTNKVGKVDDVCYRVINCNADSLSKKYIPDISPCIQMQLKIWEELKERYTGLDRAYAAEDMDYKLHKVKVYANNFYRRGSTISFRESISKIKTFIAENPDLFENNQRLPKSASLIRKIESTIIKSKKALFIGTMYAVKEKMKKIKLEYVWRNRE
jgi:glycosyltransferase involved in cell wall biosynthesis